MVTLSKTQTLNGEIYIEVESTELSPVYDMNYTAGEETGKTKVLVKTMSQFIDKEGRKSGGIQEQILNSDLYYKNLEQVRKDEDAFIKYVRDAEDSFVTLL